MSASSNNWHTLSIDEACRALDTSTDGLGAAEAELRLQAHGPNELKAPEHVSPWRLLAGQFKNVPDRHPADCNGNLSGAGPTRSSQSRSP